MADKNFSGEPPAAPIDTVTALQPRPPRSIIPLTPWQRRLWDGMVSRNRRRSEIGMCCISMRLSGTLDVSALEKSVELTIARHESLRTRITLIDALPQQWVDPQSSYHLPITDLTSVPAVELEAATTKISEQFAHWRADVSVGSLFQARLLRLSPREHLLLLAMDHFIADGTSRVVLNSDLRRIYADIVAGRSCSLRQPRLQFADYAVWLHRTHARWLQADGPYWYERLAGASSMRFPIDTPATQLDPASMATLRFTLDTTVSAGLRDIALRERTLLPLVVVTIYAAALSQWCGQRDLLMAFLSHGRHGSIGCSRFKRLLHNAKLLLRRVAPPPASGAKRDLTRRNCRIDRVHLCLMDTSLRAHHLQHGHIIDRWVA